MTKQCYCVQYHTLQWPGFTLCYVHCVVLITITLLLQSNADVEIRVEKISKFDFEVFCTWKLSATACMDVVFQAKACTLVLKGNCDKKHLLSILWVLGVYNMCTKGKSRWENFQWHEKWAHFLLGEGLTCDVMGIAAGAGMPQDDYVGERYEGRYLMGLRSRHAYSSGHGY